MRQSKFTETQIVSILKEVEDGRPVNEIWRSYGISSATYYKMESQVRRLGGVGYQAAKRTGTRERSNQADVWGWPTFTMRAVV